ncbi:hypothetical protein B5M09_012290, partial [Aphanomyces astaci]
ELYVVDPTLSETDRDARLAEIKAHTTAIQREIIAREVTKKLANQRSAVHTFLVSAISTNPYELFEHIKTRFESNPMDINPTIIASYLRTLKGTDESCIDTLSVELIDLIKRYRVYMTPQLFNPLDPSANSNRLQQASALVDNGSVATIQTRTQLAGVMHAVAAPAPTPLAITQANGSVHVMNAFTVPSYAHHDCVNHPVKSCFYCGVINHTLPACPTLMSDYARNTMRPITDAPGEHFPSPVDAGDLDFAEVPTTERLPLNHNKAFSPFMRIFATVKAIPVIRPYPCQ